MDLPWADVRPFITTGSCITCFPLRRRIRSTSENKPNSTSIRRPSRLSRPANQRGCNFEYTQKSTNPLKTKAYEKTNNINRYRQYRCGPGINIRLREYRHWRGCSKPAGSSWWSTRPTADTGTVSLSYIRDRRTQQHRSSAVWWVWANGHRGPGGLVKAATCRC